MQEIIDLIMYGGALGACLVFIAGLVRKWWLTWAHHVEVVSMWEKAYKTLEQDRDEWRVIAKSANNAAAQAVNVASHKVS